MPPVATSTSCRVDEARPNAAELELVLMGAIVPRHALLARAAMDGIVEKLPNEVDSMRRDRDVAPRCC